MTAGPLQHASATALTGRPVQLCGSVVARAVLRLAGWQVVFDGLPSRQGVLIVYPHTSNWDFVIGVLAKWAMGMPLAFWGKHTLFELPLFGRWLRWIGGVPVDRHNPHGAVAAMVGRFAAARESDAFLWLALAPEGTRSYRDSWRRGFYQVAQQADVPLALAYFDYAERRVGVDSFIRLSGDADRDMAAIQSRLGQRRGRRPQLAAPIRLPRA